MRADEAGIPSKRNLTHCGRLGCIVLYTSTDCHFCQLVERILWNAVTANGLPSKSINSVQKNLNNDVSDDGISSLPAITICDKIITGIPDEETIREALNRVSLKDCFLDDIT